MIYIIIKLLGTAALTMKEGVRMFQHEKVKFEFLKYAGL